MCHAKVLLAILSVAILAACSNSTAPNNTGDDLRGGVVDANRRPVAGATIVLQHALNSPIFPGPGKATTIIRFQLPEAGRVSVWISSYCDADTVRQLINDDLPAGEYTIAWDGRDEERRLLSDGVYWFHVVTAAGEERHDFLLLRLGYGDFAVDDVLVPLVVTDISGRFILDQGCLPFGCTFIGTDVLGIPTGAIEVIRNVRVWAFVENGGASAVSDWITVDPNLGADVTIVFGR